MLEVLAGIATIIGTYIAIRQYSENKRKKQESEKQSPPAPTVNVSVSVPPSSPPTQTIKLPPKKETSEHPWNVPFWPNENFTGRDKEMRQLREMLGQGAQAIISQVISGMGGVGKTQMAVEYAHQYKSDYPGGVLWVKGAENVILDYALLGNEKILNLELPNNMPDEDKCAHVRHCLQEKQDKTLLILDNMDKKKDYENIRHYLPTTGNCQILITTRLKDLEDGNGLPLDTLTDDDALELLKKESGRDGEDNKSGRNICRILGNLPLAIEVSGKYLKFSNKMLSFQGYYDKLAETDIFHKALLENKKLHNTDHDASVLATLAVNKELLDDSEIRKALASVICFEPDNINPEILALACGMELDDLSELVSKLDTYSIIQIQEDKRLSVHRLMRKALSHQLPQDEQKAAQKEYVVQIQQWVEEHNQIDTLKTTTPEIPHILAAFNIAETQEIWPQVYELCFNFGQYYYYSGKYRQYLEWAQEGESQVKKYAPDDKEKLGIAYNEIAVAWNFLGEYHKAIDFYQQALVTFEEVYGKEHPYVASTANNLGAVWNFLGEYHKAVDFYQQALEIDKKAFGDNHPNVAIRLNNLGSAWYALKDFKQARECLQEAYKIRLAFLGENHPYTKNTKGWLDLLPK